MNESQAVSAQPELSSPERPRTLKDRAVGLAMAVAFGAVGAAMIYKPVLLEGVQEKLSGRSSRRLVGTFELIWSRPVGVIAILLALLLVWGAFSRTITDEKKQAG